MGKCPPGNQIQPQAGPFIVQSSSAIPSKGTVELWLLVEVSREKTGLMVVFQTSSVTTSVYKDPSQELSGVKTPAHPSKLSSNAMFSASFLLLPFSPSQG